MSRIRPLRIAIPAIRRALAQSEHTWEEMKRYYAESRLRGIHQRYLNFVEQAEDLTDEELDDALAPAPDGSASPFLFLLSNIRGRSGFERDPAQTATALADAGDMETLCAFLQDTFTTAAQCVARGMDSAWFEYVHDQVENDPALSSMGWKANDHVRSRPRR